MKRYYTIINYLLCSICLLWMTGCSGILDDMRPKDLAERFNKNFVKYTGNEAGKALVAAGPQL